MKTISVKIQIISLLLFAGSWASNAQNTGAKVSGLLTDTQGRPVDYATISLLNAKDSTAVKGTLSTPTGEYTFEHIIAGAYVIKATSVGYVNAASLAFTVNTGSQNIKVPTLTLKTASRTLGTVTITGTKPLIEQYNDRTVMNVENSILAAGNSAMEILARAPGVSIDKDDNISLKGKDGVTVMIDDKLTYLSASQLATLLRSTDGNSIKSIELISNPSSKYDAAGNSGIINIKLKKNTQAGTNGSLVTSAGYGKYGKDRNTLSLNHKEGNLNVFGSFSHNDNKHKNEADIKRIVTDDATGTNTYFDQKTPDLSVSHNNSYRLGADYDMGDKNTIGFVVNGYFNGDNDHVNSLTTIGDKPDVINSYQKTVTTSNERFKNFAFNLNDRFKIDTTGQTLSFDLDYSKFNNNGRAQYNTYFYQSDGSTASDPYFLRNQTPSDINIRSGKIDYVLPVNKTFKIEAGAKYSSVKTDNDLEAQQQVNGTYVNDPNFTNRFIYSEKIAAGYINLNKSFGGTNIQAGLRAEHTNSTGELITNNQVVSRHYLDFFPSLFITHSIDKKNDIGLSYSRRIDRPGYGDLNPFISYMDQYTYTQGNPFLNPQYTNKFELTYTYDKKINFSAGYSRTNDAITGVLLTNPQTKVTIQTMLNLQTQNYYNFNVNNSHSITKWWTQNVNATVFYRGFKTDSLLGGSLNRGQVSFQSRTTDMFKISSSYKAEVSNNFMSSGTYGIYHFKPQYSTDLGISHSFANKKANLKFSVSDIFNTQRDRVSSIYQTNNLQIYQKNETRIARLTFTYNFGSNLFKARQHEDSANDLKDRVRGSN